MWSPGAEQRLHHLKLQPGPFQVTGHSSVLLSEDWDQGRVILEAPERLWSPIPSPLCPPGHLAARRGGETPTWMGTGESMCERCWHPLSVGKHCPNKFYRTDEAAGEWAPQSGDFLSFQDKNSETPQLLPSPSPSPLSLSGPFLGCLVSSLGPQGSPHQPQKGLYNSRIAPCSSPAHIPSMAPQRLQILSLVVETCMDPALSNSPPSPIPLPF